MRLLQPLSEAFLYWNPEDICQYPQDAGPEDDWFSFSARLYQVVDDSSREVLNG